MLITFGTTGTERKLGNCCKALSRPESVETSSYWQIVGLSVLEGQKPRFRGFEDDSEGCWAKSMLATKLPK